MEQRPAGITLIVILDFILGGLSLLWNGLVFGWGGFSSLFGSIFGAAQARAYGEAVAWSGFLGMIHRDADRSLIRLVGNEKWAWFLAMISVALIVLEGVVGIFGGGESRFGLL